MIETCSFRKTRHFGSSIYSVVLILIFVLLPGLLAAQQEEEKAPHYEGGTKVEGELHCSKAAPDYSIAVPDRPGHSLMLMKRQCTWTKPWVVNGGSSKTGVVIDFAEKMEGELHVHGFETDTFEGGEKITFQTMGVVKGEKAPAKYTGRWSLMRGTGKFKGIAGGGTYTGNLDANDEVSLSFDGVYLPNSIVGEKK